MTRSPMPIAQQSASLFFFRIQTTSVWVEGLIQTKTASRLRSQQ